MQEVDRKTPEKRLANLCLNDLIVFSAVCSTPYVADNWKLKVKGAVI